MESREQLELICPTAEHAEEYRAYRQEFLDAGDSMDGCGPMRRIADPAEWLAELARYADPATVPPDKVQATQYVCRRCRDGRIVGMLQLRHTLNDFTAKYAGHIGYSVRVSERRKGYAEWMLRAALPRCRELGLERILITCLETNEASRRTILSCGGVYESTVFEPDRGRRLQRYWIDLKEDGQLP